MAPTDDRVTAADFRRGLVLARAALTADLPMTEAVLAEVSDVDRSAHLLVVVLSLLNSVTARDRQAWLDVWAELAKSVMARESADLTDGNAS